MLRCTIFDSTGSATSTSGVFKKSRLCSDHGLEPRDLRKIDSRVPNLVPTILVRRGGILVNILHIRAMIKKDKVLLFDSYGSTDSQLHSAFVYNLQHNLRPPHQNAHQHTSTSSSPGALAYEFRALESILVSVLDALRIELGVVRGWTSEVLEQLDDDVDRDKLRTLLQVSRKLNAFLSRSKAVKNAVVEVLENDEDMQLMHLSSIPPSASTDKGCASSNDAHTSSANTSSICDATASNDGSQAMDELELLLESFDKQVEEVVAETTQLHSDMTNTQEVVELILDNNRNKLLALDLKTSIATMGISAGTLWAGLFGMNLKSHMEELDWAFAGVSAVAFGAVVLTAGVGLRRLERLRKVGLAMRGKLDDRNKSKWMDKWRRRSVSGAPGAPGAPVHGVYSQPALYHGLGVSTGYAHSYPAWTAASLPPEQQASWYAHAHPPPHSRLADTSTSQRDASATAPPISAANPAATAPTTPTALGIGIGLGSKWNPTRSAKRRAHKP